MNEIKKVRPFIRFCCSIGHLPTSFTESLTYEEQLIWFCNFLEKEVIPTVNENADAVIELRNFVSNYFNNLDVQDEINNKLDEMAESGKLQEIITEYITLKSLIVFDNVNAMKSDSNLINGSFASTLGYYEKGDGGNSTYKIRTKTTGDVANEKTLISISDNLVAELVIQNQEINIKQFGAIGDGETDDTSIINFALSLSSDIVKKIYLNETYLISSPLIFSNNKDLIGIKEDLQSTTYSPTIKSNSNIKVLDLTGKNNIYIKNINIKHLDSQTATVVDLSNSKYVKFENVRISHETKTAINCTAIDDTRLSDEFTGYFTFENVQVNYYNIGIKSRATYIIIKDSNINHSLTYAVWLTGEGIGGITGTNITGSGTAIRYDGEYMLNIQNCYMEGYYLNECIENTNNVPINLKGCKIFERTGTKNAKIVYDTDQYAPQPLRNTRNSFIDGYASLNNLTINGNFKNDKFWTKSATVTYLSKEDVPEEIGLPPHAFGCMKFEPASSGNIKLYQMLKNKFNKDEIVTISLWAYVTDTSTEAPLILLGKTNDNGSTISSGDAIIYNRPTRSTGQWVQFTTYNKTLEDTDGLGLQIRLGGSGNVAYVTNISVTRGIASNIDSEYSPNEHKLITDNVIFKGSDDNYYKLDYNGSTLSASIVDKPQNI